MRTSSLAAWMALAAASLTLLACGSTGHRRQVTGTSSTPPAHRAAEATRWQVVSAFAKAYTRLLDGEITAAALPDATSAARHQAQQGGVIPAAARTGLARLMGVHRLAHPAGGYDVAVREDGYTFVAQVTASRANSGRWVVTGMLTPDFEQAIVKPPARRPVQPAWSGPAESVARVFLTGFLAWYYRHGPLSAIHDASPALRRFLRAHPPNIPPTMAGLHGRAPAIGMQRHGRGWQARVNVSDGQSTYQLTLTLAPARSGWQVLNVAPR